MKTKQAIVIAASLLSNPSMADTEFSANKLSPEITSIDYYKQAQMTHLATSSPQRFIIELESPSIAQYQGGIPGYSATAAMNQGQRINTLSAHATNYASHLQNEQQAFISSLSKIVPNATIERHFKTLFNGVTLVGSGLSIEQLSAMPGVKSVYPETMYQTNMDASHEVINSAAIWQAVSGMENAGKGIRVAVIDGGIRPENPMFSEENFTKPTTGMPTDDYCTTVDASFCNNKLIVTRWSQPVFPICKDEYMSPLDFSGHGSHVAGTAVGNQVTTRFKDVEVALSGVAPAAYLMAYKALYSEADCLNTGGSNGMLMEALEHAVNDGADIINNSWGIKDGGDPANSPYKTMFEAAEAAGIVVVTAAGNSGNSAKTISCPACIESGITVANSTTGRFFANSFITDAGKLLAIEANNKAITADINAPTIAAANLNAKNDQACSAFPIDSFKGGIALISRGSCAFSIKAANAEAAGAKAMVVYNSSVGAPISMFMPDANLPSVMISNADGIALIESLGGGASIGTITKERQRIVTKPLTDLINSSSSRGPNGNENILKPDLAAPGTGILSAFSPDNGGKEFHIDSGTSMASPHVAGAAAVMRQLHPKWSANDIKTALTSTAQTEGILNDDTITPASPFAMGAGRMDLGAAAKAVLTFDKPSVAADSCVGSCTFTRTVYNKSEETSSWTLSASANNADISVSPSTLELAPGAAADLTVIVNSTFAEYGAWIFGNVMLKSGEGKQDAHLPLAIMAKESSDSSLISTMTTVTDITASDAFPIKAIVNNSLFENTVTIAVQAPEGTALTSADDVDISMSGAQQYSFNVDQKLGLITWVGKLDLPNMSFIKDIHNLPSIIDLGVTPVVCKNGCDETAITFSSLPSFKYHDNTYDSITMSDNGFAVVGGGSKSGSHVNKKLSDNSKLSNIIAPFWSNFDLSSPSGTDTGGGNMAIDVVTDHDGITWLVLEWNNAQLYGDDTHTQYTFSIWIKTGDEELVLLNYIDIPNMPKKLTIGVANIGSSAETGAHFNGQGATVTSGDVLTANSATAGHIEISYKVKATALNMGQNDVVKATEDESIVVDVLANDTKADQKVARASITDNIITAKAQRLIDIMPSGDLGNVKITTAPINGTATVNSKGQVSYLPNKDFFGTDSLAYTAEDTEGNTGHAATVNIEVANVNDAPVVNPADVTAIENTPVTLHANGTDVDGDELTYTWIQTQGTNVVFNAIDNGASINFTTPTGAEVLTFSVVATDATLSSPAGKAKVSLTVKEMATGSHGDTGGRSGGSLGWLTLLFLLPFSGRRLH